MAGEEHDPLVNQAAGMVSVQADCSIGDALEMLQARSLVSGESLVEIAEATVQRRVRFGPAP